MPRESRLLVRIKRSPADKLLTKEIQNLIQARNIIRKIEMPKRQTRDTVVRLLAGVQASCEIVSLAIRR